MTGAIPILLLAAGRSSRMGDTDKLMQSVDGKPLIRRAAEIALAAGPVIVALPPAPHPRHDALDGLAVSRVPVPDRDEGLSASLRRAIAEVPEDAPAALILLADLPDLRTEDIRSILEQFTPGEDTLVWRGATKDERPGHPTMVSRALFAALQTLTGDTGAQPVLTRYKHATRLVPLPGDRARRDLDTPEAWAAWRAERGE